VSAEKLIESIQSRKEIELARFIIGLSIDHVGEETAYDIANHFGTLSTIQNASLEELGEIDGVGGIVAESLFSWLKDKENRELIERLLRYVALIESAPRKVQKGVFSGKNIVLTGTLQSISRDEAKEIIRNKGGNVSSSVSKNTDYVVAGGDPGSKYEKAADLNLKILSEQEFLKLVETG
jgi:DNA ligase (NAD+)